MIFTSLEFFYFFAIFFPLYYLVGDRWRIRFLLAASYFFYGFWSIKCLLLLIFTMVFDYFIALRIDRSPTQLLRKRYLVASLVVNLGVLFVFKYFNFFLEIVSSVTGSERIWLDIILPFGISFYTFHAMSYVIDVYRKEIPAEREFSKYSGYVMFFPQLVAGPIARASHLLHQFEVKKRFSTEKFVEGTYLVAKGYLFKVVLADSFGGFVDSYYGNESVKNALMGAQSVYFFAFQIYLDFLGYTLIARGISKWLDFELVDNFRMPYFSTSITDFWRRWHISLSTWLRDYLYISLGGNRQGRVKQYRNLLLTMFLGGLWHGASLNFVFWGVLHGLYLSLEKWLGSFAHCAFIARVIPKPVRILFTFHLICFAWVFFRSPSFAESWSVILEWGSFLRHPSAAIEAGPFYTKLWLMMGFVLCFEWLEERFCLADVWVKTPIFFKYVALYSLIVFVALFSVLNPTEFIYFQF